MKSCNCEKVMELFLSLDKYQRLPLSLTLHLLTCRKCRTEVRLLALAEKKCSEPFTLEMPFSDAVFVSIMQKIDPDFSAEKMNFRPVTLKRWIWSGIAMILALVSFRWFTDYMTQDSNLMLAFYLVFGCIVTVYCALFIGSNLDFFIKKIHARFPAAGSL